MTTDPNKNPKLSPKLDYSAIKQAGIDEAAIKEFIEHRRKKRAPLTQGALERNMREAWRAKDLGITAEQAIYQTIDNGWQKICVDWLAKQITDIRQKQVEAGLVNQSAAVPTRQMSTEQMFSRDWAQ